MSSFSYVEPEDEVGTPFQVLSIAVEKRVGPPMSSLKDVQKIVEEGPVDQWGRVVEDNEEEDYTKFVTHGQTCKNWIVVDIPVILHRSKLVPNPIEYNDPSPSPNFEFPVFEAEEESDVEVSDELSRLLEQDEKIIQPLEEQIELVNLGSEDDVKEVKIGSRLWLDYDIVEHRLPLKPECLPVKQKLRRTHLDMAVKIKEEVQKQIDVGFLMNADYP
ncbi:hypothetical protein KIW84_062874 [Lathyrus oleraceus]|uniref:Uncharacterized protein n=1 Tax=Pisum sativum TaxID=3888 RepID=A0A9D4W854_PEA|nr:hypothetical protein KIW84_062874 [Pisum sativum]